MNKPANSNQPTATLLTRSQTKGDHGNDVLRMRRRLNRLTDRQTVTYSMHHIALTPARHAARARLVKSRIIRLEKPYHASGKAVWNRNLERLLASLARSQT